MCVCVRDSVCVCVCVCVREREIVYVSEKSVCVCVCVMIHVLYLQSTECMLLFELAQAKFSAGSFSAAHDMYIDAMEMLSLIYGPLHIMVANCYRCAHTHCKLYSGT